jgi:hypothetical protein
MIAVCYCFAIPGATKKKESYNVSMQLMAAADGHFNLARRLLSMEKLLLQSNKSNDKVMILFEENMVGVGLSPFAIGLACGLFFGWCSEHHRRGIFC